MSDDKVASNPASEVAAKLAPKIYDDVFQPSAKRVGVALETIFKVGASPIALLDWGFEQSKEWLAEKIRLKIESTSPEHRVTPPLATLVSAAQGVAITADQPELKGLYAELLLKAFDSRTAAKIHPAYFAIIEQLSPQEALVFISFRNHPNWVVFTETVSAYPQLKGKSHSIEGQFARHCGALGLCDDAQAGIWLSNLQRLGLLELDGDLEVEYLDEDRFYSSPRVSKKEHRYLTITDLGRAFLDACAPAEEKTQ